MQGLDAVFVGGNQSFVVKLEKPNVFVLFKIKRPLWAEPYYHEISREAVGHAEDVFTLSMRGVLQLAQEFYRKHLPQ